MIGLIRNIQLIIVRAVLFTISKSFLSSHLGYGDVIYDYAFNESFRNRLESVQYNAALAITGAIRDSSREKLYQELVLESLRSRRWYRKLCLFFKLFVFKKNSYFFKKNFIHIYLCFLQSFVKLYATCQAHISNQYGGCIKALYIVIF